MPSLVFPYTFAPNTAAQSAQVNGNFAAVTTLLNSTLLDSTNIQTGGIATANIADSAITVAKLASAVQALLVPTGSVMAYTGTSAPTGWLLCDGSAVSRTTYSALFAITGSAHGSGDGSTTFNLPNYKGRFLRGRDGGAGVDVGASRTAMASGGNTGDNVGSIQGCSTKLPNTSFTTDSQGAHTHTVNGTRSDLSVGGSSSAYNSTGTSATTSSNGAHTHTITGGGDNETSPVNAYVNYIIKT